MRTTLRLVAGVLLVALGALSPRLVAQRQDGGVRLDGATQGTPITNPIFSGTLCLDATNKDVGIARVGTTDLGIYTGTCGGSGVLRLDVSATAVTSGVPVLLPNGTAAAPSLTFASGTNDGLYRVGTHELALSLNGAAVIDYFTSGTAYGSGYLFGWSSNADPTVAARDVVLRRSAAKTLTLDTDGASGALTLVDVKGPLTASGTITASSGSLVSGSTVVSPSTGTFLWTGRSEIDALADGTVRLRNSGHSAGVSLDFTTDGTAWFKTAASSPADTAILKASQFNATGGVGVAAYSVNGAAGIGAFIQAQPADQTARSSAGSFVMMGLGAAAAPCTITPTSTGRVKFEINGDLVNNTTATTVTIQMAENTGTAPANNAAATGTVISKGKVIDGLTSDLTAAFHLTGIKTGLAIGTAVWFDIQLQTSGANTGQPTNVDCVAHEL